MLSNARANVNAVKQLFTQGGGAGANEEVVINGTRYSLDAAVLGEGGFSKVYRGWTSEGSFAVKRSFLADADGASEVQREIAVLTKLRGEPHVVRLVGASVFGKVAVVAMELCGESASSLLQRKADVSGDFNAISWCIVGSAAHALCAMHGLSPPLAHRDIKLENLLSTSPTHTQWKLCDFGSTSTQAHLCTTAAHAEEVMDEVSRKTTVTYRSPEQCDPLRGYRIDQSVDVWALGVTAYALLFSEFPFEDTPLGIVNGKLAFPPMYRASSASAVPETREKEVKTIAAMLSKDPVQRPDVWAVTRTARELLGGSHPWVLKHAEPVKPAGWCEQEQVAAASQAAAPRVAAQRDEAGGGRAAGGFFELHGDLAEGEGSGDSRPEDVPVIDGDDVVPRVHVVPALEASPTRLRRNWAARIKDWVESHGAPAHALKLFHADTPHAWVIRCTDGSLSSIRTLYRKKLIHHVSREDDASALFHYIQLRPVSYDAVVAYKVLCLIHDVLRAATGYVQQQVYAGHKRLFTSLQRAWSSPDQAAVPLPGLAAFIVKYCEYLRKRVYYHVRSGSFRAATDEEAAILADLFVCGVDLSSNMKPPLHGKYALYNDALVMMVLDLKEINQGIDDAPVSGSRWRQVEADVSAASERFGLFAEAVSRTMPEIALTIADGRRRSVTPPRSSSQSPGGEDEVLHVESFSTDEVYFMYPLGATSHTLGELVTLPVNRKCADCAAGVPTWCSIDLGTFICGNCARFHADCLPFRPPANLQTDPFEAEDLDQLARVGNGRANAVWLGLSDRPAQPPAPAQGAGGFREYLLDKYARRKWVPPLHVLESLAPPVEPAEELSTAAPNAWQQQHQQHQQQHQQQQQQQQQHQQQHQQQQQQGAFGFLFGGGDGSAAGASPRSGGLEHEDADCLFPAISAVDARSSVTFPDPVQAQPGPPGSDLDSLFSAPAVNTKPATASGGADDLFSVNDLFSTGSTSPHQQSPGDRATPGGPSARGAPNNKADDPFSDLFGTAQLPKQAAPVQPSAGGKPSDPFAFDF